MSLYSVSLIFLKKSLDFEDEKSINYQEISNLDYKVYLKENDFYEQDYLGKDMLYVAGLIKNISINYDYKFNVDNNLDMVFDYSIIGKLSIKDESGDKTFYEKEYTLLDNQSNETNEKIFNINKTTS